MLAEHAYYTVKDATERDALLVLLASRLTPGLTCYVISEGKYYELSASQKWVVTTGPAQTACPVYSPLALTITSAGGAVATEVVRLASAGVLAKAQADTAAHAAAVIGVYDGTSVVPIHEQPIAKFDSAPVVGQPCYLSATVAGAMTSTLPASGAITMPPNSIVLEDKSVGAAYAARIGISSVIEDSAARLLALNGASLNDATQYGLDPSNSGALNDAAMSRAFAASKQIVVSKHGVYTFDSTLVIPEGTVVICAGSAAVTFKWAASAAVCLRMLSGSQLHGVTIDGTANRAATAVDLGGTLQAVGVVLRDEVVENFTDTGGVGIRVGSAIGTDCTGLLISGADIGILFDGQPNGVYPTTNRFSGEVRYCAVGVEIWRGTLNLLRDLTLQSNTIAKRIKPRGELPACNFDDNWDESNTEADLDVDLRAAPINIACSIANSWNSVGTRGGYRRRGLSSADGSIDLTITGSTLYGWPLYIAPRDVVSVQSKTKVGAILNYGTLNAPAGSNGWSAYLDADSGLTGSAPSTAWASSQEAPGVLSALTNCALNADFGGTGTNAVRLTGSGGGEITGMDLTRWAGINAPVHIDLEFSLDASHASGNDALITLKDDGANFLILLLTWSSGSASVWHNRTVGGTTHAAQQVGRYSADNIPKYLALDFFQGILWLSSETGAFYQTPLAASASSFTPTHVILGSTPVWGGRETQAGLSFRRVSLLLNRFGSPSVLSQTGHYYDSGWEQNDSRNQLEFWKGLTAI
jgi:hypothetical protein